MIAYVKAACLIALTVFLCAFLWEARGLMRDMDAEIPQLDATLMETHEAVSAMHTAAGALPGTVAKLNAAADQESNYWNRQNVEALKIMAAAKEVLVRTDCSLNGGPGCAGALPQLAVAVQASQASIEKISFDVDATTNNISPILSNLAKASGGLMAQANDPKLPETLANIDRTSASMAASAEDIHSFIHRETTPVRGTWNTIKAFLREFAGPAAQIATAAK